MFNANSHTQTLRRDVESSFVATLNNLLISEIVLFTHIYIYKLSTLYFVKWDDNDNKLSLSWGKTS